MGICADALTSIEDLLTSGYVLSKLDDETLTKLRETVLPELTSQITKFTFEDTYLKTKTIIEGTSSPINVYLYEAENNLAINAEEDQEKIALFVQSESLLDKNTFILLENNILSELEELNNSSSNLVTNTTFTSKLNEVINKIESLVTLSSFNFKIDEIKTLINDLLSELEELNNSSSNLVTNTTFTSELNEVINKIESLVTLSSFNSKIDEIKTLINDLLTTTSFNNKINEIKTIIEGLLSSTVFTTKINEIKTEIIKNYSITNSVIYSNTFSITTSNDPYDSFVDIDLPEPAKKTYNFEFYSISPSASTGIQIYTKREIGTKSYWVPISSDYLFEHLDNVYTSNLHSCETQETIYGSKIRIRVFTEDAPTSNYEVDLIVREL